MKWLVSRLKERSTWIGIAAVLTSAGLTVAPDLQEAIISIGLGFAGVVAFITKDKTTGV